ncbi:MAG: FtsB family cell division protein [Anaerocolumna sp.]
MQENKKTRYPYPVDGNTAKKLQVIPNYIEEEDILRVPVRKQKKQKAVKPAMSFFTLFLLCVAIGGTLYTCVDYLNVQSTILSNKHEITKLEKQLLKLQNENTAAKTELNASLDLKSIYEVATKELGMVYPNEEQVISYKSTKSDYVKQYKDIPEDNTSSILDKLLNP